MSATAHLTRRDARPLLAAKRLSSLSAGSGPDRDRSGKLVHVLRQRRVTVFERLRPPWGRRPAPTPWAPLRRPLADCRLALVASSVCLAHGGRRSDPGVRVGDPLLRTIAGDVLTAELLSAGGRRSDTSAAISTATSPSPSIACAKR